MGRKIGTSRPMVLDVLLSPFTESFSITKSDAIHQWRYDQTGEFLPDRATTPLLLTPELTVCDPETNEVYQPSFYRVQWYSLNTATGKYDTEITNTTDGDVDYVLLSSGALKVKKNVVETAPVSLLCVVTYIDPRNAGKTYTVRDKVQLTTSRDTSVTTPRVEIDQEAVVQFNPFIDGYSDGQNGLKTKTFQFNATVRLGDTIVLRPAMNGEPAVTSTKYQVRWYAMGEGITSETLIDATDNVTGAVTGTLKKFLTYVSGQNTPTLTVDAMRCEALTVIARVYDLEAKKLYPDKAVNSLRWESFKVDATTEAIDGGAVKQDTIDKTFRNIVTLRNRTLSQDQVNENFTQEFMFRQANTSGAADRVESLGCGPTMTVPRSKLAQSDTSLVYSELELRGPYVLVVDDVTGQVVVDDATGKAVVERK